MPRCVNDPVKSFKGSEPSPKGLGLCAHAEKAGTVRMGRNGRQWFASATGKGVVRWTPYDKKKRQQHRRPATKEMTRPVGSLPKGLSGYDVYMIEGNYGASFCVYLKDGKDVRVFALPENREISYDYEPPIEEKVLYFTRPVWSSSKCSYRIPLTIPEKSKSLGGDIVKTGTMLLRDSSDSQKYTYIDADGIYEFQTANPVIEFFDDRDVPDSVSYPVVLTQSHVLFMLDRIAVPISAVPEKHLAKPKKRQALYGWFYAKKDEILENPHTLYFWTRSIEEV